MGLTGIPNEDLISKYLTDNLGFSPAAAAGVLANLYKESMFNPSNVQNGFGYDDDEYTSRVIDGSYGSFITDSIGYGLAQWTYRTRKRDLQNFLRTQGRPINDLYGQLDFMFRELTQETSYKRALDTLKNCANTSDGAYQAAYDFCMFYEAPSNTAVRAHERGQEARNFFMVYKDAVRTAKGKDIADTALKQKGKPYAAGDEGYGPDKFNKTGLAYYCYKEHGIDIPKSIENQAKLLEVPLDNVQPGDILIFGYMLEENTILGKKYTNKKEIFQSGIADYNKDSVNKNVIFFNLSRIKTLAGTSISDPNHQAITVINLNADNAVAKSIKDILIKAVRPATVNVPEYTGYISEKPTYSYGDLAGTSLPMSVADEYEDNLISALESLQSNGDSYSSIINLRTNEEFKFYTNHSVSESLPTNYSSPGNIMGRSVPLLGYDSTGARTVNLTLDLFAGTPYRPDIDLNSEDLVGVLHQDLDLLKSFEYPDYSSSIVIPPPIVLLSIGETLKIRGVLQGLSIEYKRPYDEKNRAMHATVSFTVTQVSEDPPGAYDIKTRTTRSY